MLVNGCLLWIIEEFNSSTVENLEKVINNHYSGEDIITAKKDLWGECSAELDEYPSRQGSVRRTATSAHIQDIIEAIKKLDVKGKLPDVYVKDLKSIPDRLPEELNIYWVF